LLSEVELESAGIATMRTYTKLIAAIQARQGTGGLRLRVGVTVIEGDGVGMTAAPQGKQHPG
jgi:hypothetical protein